ncbi:MAG: tetratricopeptide repeat protein, partial [Rivularia sp. (in: cyanobacteria)]
EVDNAIALYQQSLDLDEKIGNVQGKAASLHQLAGIYAQLGDVDNAIALFQQSLELLEKIGDVQGKAASLHQLAGIYASRGDVDNAIALFQQSLELKEKIGNVQGKAASLCMLGQLLADEKQDYTTALEYLQESFEIFEHLKSPTAQTAKEIIDRIRAAQIKSTSQDSSNGIIAFWRKLINKIRKLGIGY